jgi:hypothetical protein
MADFKTHLTASTVLGLGYGGAAYATFGVPLPTSILAAGLCSVSGMLPDIDSGPGRPLKEITSFMAAVVPTMLFRRLLHLGMSHESIILTGAAVYVAIRFGLAWFLRHYTVHRGMFHSFVAAAIFGELTFLLADSDNVLLRWFMAGGVALGYLSHLVLDEVYSVQWNGLPRLKSSFGTAMKFVGAGWWPNLSAYAKFAVLTFLVVKEPGFMRELSVKQVNQVVQNLGDEIPDSWWEWAMTAPGDPSSGEKPADASTKTASRRMASRGGQEPRASGPLTTLKAQPGTQPASTQPTDTAPQPATPRTTADDPAPLAWPSQPATGETDDRLRR